MSGEEKLVLVVDDDDGFRAAVVRLISAGGYNVEAFSTIEQLSRRLPNIDEACILADIVLRGECGLEIRRLVNELARPHPIIFMTASEDLNLYQEAERLGATRCLKKPFEASDLLSALREAFLSAQKSEDG